MHVPAPPRDGKWTSSPPRPGRTDYTVGLFGLRWFGLKAVVGLKFQVGGQINCFMKTDRTSTEMDPNRLRRRHDWGV